MLAPMQVFAATTSGQAVAVVVENISITNEQPLSFGFIRPTGGGSVTVTAQGARKVSGGVQTEGAEFHRASFKVQGAPDRSYVIHTPSSQIFTVDNAGENNLVKSLTVNQFTTSTVNNSKLGSNGQDIVYLGGTLVVPPNAAPGVYSGLVPLTVSY